MTTATDSGSVRSTLIDISNCIGCRACQVACKQWNEKDGEKTEFDDQLGFQNPATLSANTFTLIAFHEMANAEKVGGVVEDGDHGNARAHRLACAMSPANCRVHAGEPCWIRTSDLLIKSQLLYRLS